MVPVGSLWLSVTVCGWQGPSFDSKLVALVVNICSLLVVNTKANITETDLTNLSSFARLARAADGRWVCPLRCVAV